MEDLINPIIILVIGLMLASVAHYFLNFRRDLDEDQAEEEKEIPIEEIQKEEVARESSRQDIHASFDVWQGIKLGFGFGIGLMLATVLIWVILGSLFAISIASFLGALMM